MAKSKKKQTRRAPRRDETRDRFQEHWPMVPLRAGYISKIFMAPDAQIHVVRATAVHGAMRPFSSECIAAIEQIKAEVGRIPHLQADRIFLFECRAVIASVRNRRAEMVPFPHFTVTPDYRFCR